MARRRKAGSFHSQLLPGFSMVMGTSCAKQRRISEATNPACALPVWILAWSHGLRSGMPPGNSELRRAGGPPGRFLAMVKLWQGMPHHTARQEPSAILARRNLWSLRFRRLLSEELL